MRYTLGITNYFDHGNEEFQAIVKTIGYSDYSSGGGDIDIELLRKPTEEELAALRNIVADSVLRINATPIEQDVLDEAEAVMEDAASVLEQAGNDPAVVLQVAADLRAAIAAMRDKLNG